MVKALSKLKFLITVDPLNTETSNFWQNHGEMNDVDPAQIQTTVFRLPSCCFAEENGSIVNSARWLQWHWKGADAPRSYQRRRNPLGIFHRVRKLYEAEGGKVPEQVLNMTWNYFDRDNPTPEEVAQESNGLALVDLKDADGNVIVKKGEQLTSFAQLRDDGTTASGCWIFAGSWTPQGNQMARRDNADPTGLGNTLGWAWAWPLNRRVIYNRASADPRVNRGIRNVRFWNGTAASGSVWMCRTTAMPRRIRMSGRLSCSRKGWAACLLSIRWRKGRSLSTTSRLKPRSALTRCIRMWSPTRSPCLQR